MIQRIQSVWLLLAALCAFLTLKLSFYSGNKIVNNQKQFLPLNATENIPLTILAVAVGIAAVIIIFLYKDRKMQLRLTVANLLLSILNIILFFSAIKNYVEGNYDVTSIVLFLVPVFLLLAARGIYRDERLVRSANRLR